MLFLKNLSLTKMTNLIFSRGFSSICKSKDMLSTPMRSFSGLMSLAVTPSSNFFSNLISQRTMASLYQMHMTGPHVKRRSKKSILDGNPQMKGVVLKTLIKKPKKPNSANRKCVLVRLSNGKEAVAYVPGEGHNLQEHNVVLVHPRRLQDCIGVKLKVIRGALDCAHVVKKSAMK